MSSKTEINRIIYKCTICAVCALSIVNLVAILQSLFGSTELFEFGKIDALEYWSAFHILTSGGDPYSDQQMLSFQSNIRNTVSPIMMWNPPWLLSIFAGLLQINNFELFCRLWFISSLASYLIAACMLIFTFSSQNRSCKELWIILLSFPPLLSTFMLGQISNWLLLGASLFLTGVKKNNSLLIGGGLLLMSLKPHLVIALIPLIIGEFINSKYSLRFIIKIFLTPLTAIFPIVFAYPYSIKNWILSLTGYSNLTVVHSTRDWATTTLPSVFQRLTDISFNYTIYTICFIALLYYLIKAVPGLNKMGFYEKFILISTTSLPFSYFSWFYDYVLLVPALIILWNKISADNKLIFYIFIFQFMALSYCMLFMSELQHGILVILPICIFFTYYIIKVNKLSIDYNI